MLPVWISIAAAVFLTVAGILLLPSWKKYQREAREYKEFESQFSFFYEAVNLGGGMASIAPPQPVEKPVIKIGNAGVAAIIFMVLSLLSMLALFISTFFFPVGGIGSVSFLILMAGTFFLISLLCGWPKVAVIVSMCLTIALLITNIVLGFISPDFLGERVVYQEQIVYQNSQSDEIKKLQYDGSGNIIAQDDYVVYDKLSNKLITIELFKEDYGVLIYSMEIWGSWYAEMETILQNGGKTVLEKAGFSVPKMPNE